MNIVRRLVSGYCGSFRSRCSSATYFKAENFGSSERHRRLFTPNARRDLAPPEETMSAYRLPPTVRPKSYDLTLKPNLVSGEFGGEVVVDVEVLKATDEIRLHADDLQVLAVEADGRPVAHEVDEAHELLTLKADLGDVFGVGLVRLRIAFVADMRKTNVGFYTSKYRDTDGREISIATSKFEPTYARQAFPCFDEPNMKAKFTVHLLRPNDTSYVALSNMPQDGETEVEDGVMVHFKESVPMSTYLACFIVSDFKASSDVIHSTLGDIPFKVYATPAQLKKTDYARRTGKKIMEFYLSYFNIPYPLPKLDMVAIPDFVSGAMEHWGLVTYRETALLYDPAISSTSNKQRVATVVAHELAHSWFGNLVTMNWWNDLWLNEGFASYIEYKGVDAAEPTWQMLGQFIVEDMHTVLNLDATLGSHPIVQSVETPNEITAIFDAISYNKGASVLRMLENAVGDDVFQKGVTNYLTKYEYGNAITQDLLNELQTLVNVDVNVTDFMNTWTVQMGYPVISARKIKGGYRLTQKRFLTNPKSEGKDTSETPYSYKWTIPVTYITSNNSVPTLRWFKHSEEFIDVPSEDAWLKFNHKQVGYYRVNYEPQQWKNLIHHMKDFDVSDRAHLLEETFSVAASNQLGYDVPLSLTKYLKEEREHVPWVVASRALKKIKRYMTNSVTFSDFKEYVVKIVHPAYLNLSWEEREDDPHLRKHARVTVLGLACSMGHEACLAEAKKKFSRWLKGEESLSQDLRSLVYEYGMITASRVEWEQMWERFVAEGDAAEKLKLLNGLASVNDMSLLWRLIDLAKDETYIRSQDYFTCLKYISSNPVGTSLVWDYVREHWETLVERFGLNDRYLGRLIPSITETFSTNVKKEEMKAFFAAYPDAGAGASARVQALETVENNIDWLDMNKESVESWIRENKDFS